MKVYTDKAESTQELRDIILQIILNQKKGRVLDAGAGSGKMAKQLAEKGFDVRACDIDIHNFKYKEIPIDKADLNQTLPYPNESFNYIVAQEVIEHLENPWQFIREAHRILKPNGLLIISTPNPESIRGRFNYLLGKPFPFFTYKKFKNIYHVTPIFSWNLERMIENKFKLIETKYKMHTFPKTNIKMPLRTILFSEINFFVLERLPD